MNFGTPTSIKTLQNPSKFEVKSNRLKRLKSSQVGSQSAIPTFTSLNKRIKVEYENRCNQYEFSLNLYSIPPFGEIELEEAQNMVEERLKILSAIDDVQAEKAKSKGPFLYNEALAASLKSLGNVFINEVSGGKENKKVQIARRKDHCSHFLLRLLVCSNDELKKWFIQKEVDLLRFRLDSEKSTLDLVKLLIYNNLNFQEVEPYEKQILLKQNKINFNNTKNTVSNVYYKIPFVEALDLVKQRRAYLQDGFCYCSSNEMVTIISSKFRLQLSRALASMFNNLPQLEENHRLQPIFKTIYNNLIKGKKATRQLSEGNKEIVTPDMIDELAVESFPPCMRNTHELLRANHHLKHYGRLHYGLFLKGIGLSLDDAMSFFREEFMQSMTTDKFQKEHSYNIRYNYGKEGKRINLSAFSCAKIISGNAPGIGDSHGCPFKHFDSANLTKMFKKHNIDNERANEMLDLAKTNKPNAACSIYFSCKNKNFTLPQDIYHPNQYFVESRKVTKNLHFVQPITKPDSDSHELQDGHQEKESNDQQEDVDMAIEQNKEAAENLDMSLLNDINFEDSLDI